jgi:hypothetical protein
MGAIKLPTSSAGRAYGQVCQWALIEIKLARLYALLILLAAVGRVGLTGSS